MGRSARCRVTPFEPPVNLLPLENDRPDDLGKGKRQHREIDAREPHREPAEQQRAKCGRDRRAASASPIGAANHFTASAAP